MGFGELILGRKKSDSELGISFFFLVEKEVPSQFKRN